jgi:adenine-specific DNA-methyltransferase
VRYIGNKTRLLDFIRRTLRSRVIRTGVAVDPFSGTGSVARALKRWGFRVIAGDLMAYAHVLAHARVQADGLPEFQRLAETGLVRAPTSNAVLRLLNTLPGTPGFIHEHYSPEGAEGARHERMYFTPENAARIDVIRTCLHDWRKRDLLDDDQFYVLLAALIEAADRVANTTGVYAAFVKTWQPNARKPLELRAPDSVRGTGCTAMRTDAIHLVAKLEPFEVLYLDPPYNSRQYAGYYHVPEVIARGWWDEPIVTRGKTGLISDADRRSDWSRASRAESAFETLVATARWKHLVMSYNAEGLIAESTIERILREHGTPNTYRRYRRRYKRYRSDSDSERRQYSGDVVTEYLYCVDR